MKIESVSQTAAASDRSAGQAKNADGAKETALSFAEVLKTAAEKPLRTRRIPLGDPRDETIGKAEKEDKYCSLCGSMIDKDGSCPLCGVPLFLSGKPDGGSVPRTEQTSPQTNAAPVNMRESSSRADTGKGE